MATETIDFGNSAGQDHSGQADNNSVIDNKTNDNQSDVTSLEGDEDDDITGKDGKDNSQEISDDNNNPSTGELNPGDKLEVDGVVYQVADNGDLVDDKGNVFKEAKDVNEWLKSVEVEDSNDGGSINISDIQKEIGIEITDENDTPIEFTNDAAGVKAYVDSVIDLKSRELQEAAVNRLYADNPLLKQFQDYVQLTGSARGFGDIPDRSGIMLDKDNEMQLVAVIKMAANEFGNKSLNDNYIAYLRDSGGLYDEAKQQLKALVDKDKAYQKEIEQKAAQQREEHAKELAAYWSTVDKLIHGRVISGYKIPESFTKEVNGQKLVITPKDFFNYVAKPTKQTENGRAITGYQYDLANLTDEEYLNREMLDAWLMFTGGTYKDLIDMAVKEDKVRQLRIKAKEQRSNKTVKIIKNSSSKSSIDDIIL